MGNKFCECVKKSSSNKEDGERNNSFLECTKEKTKVSKKNPYSIYNGPNSILEYNRNENNEKCILQYQTSLENINKIYEITTYRGSINPPKKDLKKIFPVLNSTKENIIQDKSTNLNLIPTEFTIANINPEVIISRNGTMKDSNSSMHQQSNLNQLMRFVNLDNLNNSKEDIKYYRISYFKSHTDKISCLLFLDEISFASASWDKSIKIWKINFKNYVRSLDIHTAPVNCLEKINSSLIASGSNDKTVIIWDYQKFECVKIIRDFISSVQSILTYSIFDKNANRNIQSLLCATINDGIKVYNLEDAKNFSLKIDIPPKNLITENIKKIVRYKNNKVILYPYADGVLTILDIDTLKSTIISKNTSYNYFDLVVLSDNCNIACNYYLSDKVISIINIESGEIVKLLKGHENAVYCLLELPDYILASGSWDKKIRLWNICSSECFQIIEDHSSPINSLSCFNSLFISGGTDQIINLYEISKD